MVKVSGKASVKSRKKPNEPSAHEIFTKQEIAPTKLEVTPVDDTDFAEITIDIECYQHILPNYPSSYIFAKCQYLGSDKGETGKILMTDDSILVTDQRFKIICNTESPKELDSLVTNPVIIKIYQVPNAESNVFIENTANKTDIDKLILDENESSIESAISLYEALTGDIVEKVDFLSSPSSHRQVKGKPKPSKQVKNRSKTSKLSKGSKESDSKLSTRSSKESKKSHKSSDKNSFKASSPKKLGKEILMQSKSDNNKSDMEVGVCIVDLLPLIFGKSAFTEFVPIITPQPFCDDRMTRYSYKPGLNITISINKPIEFGCKPNLLNVTLESIYNVPSIMNEEMEYQICIILPTANLPREAILLRNGVYKTTPRIPDEYKHWPDIPKEYFNITQYKLDTDSEKIKNTVDENNLHEVLLRGYPRIEFNFIKRNILLKSGFLAFYDHIKKFRRVVLEIHAFKKKPVEMKKENIKERKVKSKTKVSESSLVDDGTKTKSTSHLHLMTVVDFSPLLYPGVTKIRVATPITTFHEQEALLYGGLEKSYFFPSAPKVEDKTTQRQTAKTKIGTKGRIKSKDSKSSKSTKSNKKSEGSKKGKKGVKHEQEKNLNMQNALPPELIPERPPEPSFKVYNEEGKPTFAVLEIEVTEALVEKRKIDELDRDLRELVQKKRQTPKVILEKNLGTEFSHSIVREIVLDINKKYITYVDKRCVCYCEKQADFSTYLKRCGIYQNLVVSMAQIAALIAQFRLNIIENSQTLQEQQHFVEQIFIFLMTEINEVLHKMTRLSRSVVKLTKSSPNITQFYAKEAVEMRNIDLAQRYYLETLQHSSNDPEFWFAFSVYKLELNEYENAFICIQEALSKEPYHRNSLLLCGILLAEKKRLREAELCFLTVMIQEPHFVEGWTVLYLFYKDTDNTGGMDLAQEMARKYLDDPRSITDNFNSTEDLAWTSSICPNTIYFRTGVMLLKMRIYSWVEHALSYELKEYGVVHYMLAANCYYKKDYAHALEHLGRARYFHGSDYAVLSLTGHCYLALGYLQAAHEEYLHILESFERPEDTHLLYLNCAKATENTQEAKKLLLLACKHHPTPYTWMSCGIAYFKQNDLMSAEECFSESVILDNSTADCWGYLTLINLKTKKCSEAEICYELALKNNLENTELLNAIRNGFRKLKLTK